MTDGGQAGKGDRRSDKAIECVGGIERPESADGARSGQDARDVGSAEGRQVQFPVAPPQPLAGGEEASGEQRARGDPRARPQQPCFDGVADQEQGTERNGDAAENDRQACTEQPFEIGGGTAAERRARLPAPVRRAAGRQRCPAGRPARRPERTLQQERRLVSLASAPPSSGVTRGPQGPVERVSGAASACGLSLSMAMPAWRSAVRNSSSSRCSWRVCVIALRSQNARMMPKIANRTFMPVSPFFPRRFPTCFDRKSIGIVTSGNKTDPEQIKPH